MYYMFSFRKTKSFNLIHNLQKNEEIESDLKKKLDKIELEALNKI